MTAQQLLPRDARVLVAGSGGLVGSAVVRALGAAGFSDVVGARSAQVDLRDADAAREFVTATRPDVVVDAAARVGGIAANDARPVEFLHDNLRIQANLLDAAHAAGTERLFLGSSCIYPKFAEQPIREDSLLTGALEPTNDAYAIAKIAGIMGVQSYRREYERRWISAMPTNLYGPGDNFDLESSHVLPALIQKFHEATVNGEPSVTVWGTGTPRREFLHVDDLAAACVHLLEAYDDPAPINVGTGEDVTIAELASAVARTVGFSGDIVYDTSRPDGTPRKVLDVSKIAATGWKPRIGLTEGLASTYRWYLTDVAGEGAGAEQMSGVVE
ncbi:GDP-L-fucose synthase family protein [Actinomycetospora sp. CA-084318]|uniref:GDP-L-fucose synthase family protein n=1 Tax=Actinomycetospora sp. CA-084318 TaxID=3239892 RepID=UPI003D975BB0